MALSNEDKGDVKAAFGKKVAGAVSRATHDTPGQKIAKSPYKSAMMRVGHYFGEDRPSEKEWNRELKKDSKNKAVHAKTDMAKKIKSKDTRDSFMKGLDRHKDDAVMKGYI